MDAPFLVRRDEVQHHRGVAVRLAVDHRLDRLGVDRRPVDAKAFAESAHPQMILIQLLTAGQRPPRDQFVDVGVAGVVADLLGFQTRPDRRGDDLARLRDHVAKPYLFVLLGRRQMGVVSPGKALQRSPGLDRDLTVGFRSETENDFACIDSAFDAGKTLAGALLGHDAVELLEQIDLMVGVPAHALATVAELVHQRPERGEALVEIRIVTLDYGDCRHGLAWDRIDLALLPVFHVEGLGDLAGAVMHDRGENDILFDPEDFRRNLREGFRDAFIDVPVAARFPDRIDRG